MKFYIKEPGNGMRVKKILLLTLVFLYIFHISFIFFPYFFRTRLIIGLFGVLLFLINENLNRIEKPMFRLISFIFCGIIPILITSVVNQFFDVWFIQNIFLQLFYVFGAYLIISYLKKIYKGEFNIIALLDFIIISVLCHNALATVMYILPSIGEKVNALQNFEGYGSNALENTLKFGSRFIGLGIGSYFIGGVLCGYTLILTAVRITLSDTVFKKVLYCFIFLFLFVTGLFIARTVIVGALLASTMLFLNYLKNSNTSLNVLKVFLMILFALAGALGAYFMISMFSISIDSIAFQHAFEVFINIFSGEGVSTSSTQTMLELYVFPDTLKTWLIGDAQFTDGASFYKGTDIGYLRLIYYFGLIGCIFYFAPFLYMLSYIRKNISFYVIDRLMIFSILYLLILNLKGMTDLNYFLYLLFFFFMFKGKERYVQKIR